MKLLFAVSFLIFSAFAEAKNITPSSDSVVNSIGMKLVRLTLKDSEVVYIGATEVTQKQWEKIMGSNPSFQVGEDNPVECISWVDANEFCSRLSRREGKIYRLPHESEWNAAASVGKSATIPENDLAHFVWSIEDKEHVSHPVATKQPNALGLYDMFGNVEEWCSDKAVRGGSFLHSLSSCLSDTTDKFRNETLKGNDMGFRVICEDK